MIFVVLRVVIVAAALWILWRLCIALFPAKRSPRTGAQDEWSEVLEEIDELPETTDPQLRAQDQSEPLQHQPHPSDGAAAQAPIEAVIVREAEAALSRIREGDDHERLAAYHEIAIYKKLCSMADGHISETTWKIIDDTHRQAQEIIGPPEKS